jgi:non-ribosomal peptide synthetase component E (peptide arylation enzyme)
MPKWDVNLALDLIPKYKIRRIPLIPSVILQILDAQKKRKVDLSSLMWLGRCVFLLLHTEVYS